MTTRDDVTRLLKDALANLYDPVRLQTHPLGPILNLRRLDGETDSETLRRYLREKIDSLRPPGDTHQNASTWLGHQVLLLHYVRCLGPAEVCRDLNISQATFYRRQREATDALVDIIWEERSLAAQASSALLDGTPDNPRHRAIALASRMPSRSIDLAALIQDITQIIAPLADKEGIALEVALDPGLPQVWADPAMLRQALLALLSECMCRAQNRAMVLNVDSQDGEICGEICMLGLEERALKELAESQPFKLGAELLKVYGGRVWQDLIDPQRPCVCFALDAREPQTILIVDDDQDTVDLYRRYLGRAQYVVRSANTAEEVEAALAGTHTDLILLDVLLPRRDGWNVLNMLRSRAETAQTPVIVCSVIEQPELAIALGAVRVLNKPITEEQLLVAVRQVLQQTNSPEPPHPAAP